MAKKNYVLDTNLFLRDPEALYAFQDNDIFIPIGVIDEIDNNKRGNEIYNFNARNAIKLLLALQDKHLTGEVTARPNPREYFLIPPDGIPRGNGLGKLYFINPPEGKKFYEADDEIIDYLEHCARKSQDIPTILVTLDAGLIVKTRGIGLLAEEYLRAQAIKDPAQLMESPDTQIELPTHAYDALEEQDFVVLSDEEFTPPEKWYTNNYVNLFGNKSMLLQYVKKSVKEKKDNGGESKEIITHILRKLLPGEDAGPIFGITSRNREQTYLFDLCLNDEVRLGTVLGKAGTGKTLIPLAIGLHGVIEEGKYDRVIVIRPVSSVGKGVGYLPGSKDEKIAPYMEPIVDVLEVISKATGKNMSLEKLVEQKHVILETPNFMRGRTLAGSFIMIDEAQNLTPQEIKTLITRIGEDSKIICTGDPRQIDETYLHETTNGLVHATNGLKGRSYFSTVTLYKSERSYVAEDVARIL